MLQNKKVFVEGLKENDAYPADPEDGYGWEKLLVKECRHFTEDFGLQTRCSGIIMYMDQRELTMVEEKKRLLQYVEK